MKFKKKLGKISSGNKHFKKKAKVFDKHNTEFMQFRKEIIKGEGDRK